LQHQTTGAKRLEPFVTPIDGTPCRSNVVRRRENVPWVGNDQPKHYRILVPQVDHFTLPPSSSDYVFGFYEDREGNLWCRLHGILFPGLRLNLFNPEGDNHAEVDFSGSRRARWHCLVGSDVCFGCHRRDGWSSLSKSEKLFAKGSNYLTARRSYGPVVVLV